MLALDLNTSIKRISVFTEKAQPCYTAAYLSQLHNMTNCCWWCKHISITFPPEMFSLFSCSNNNCLQGFFICKHQKLNTRKDEGLHRPTSPLSGASAFVLISHTGLSGDWRWPLILEQTMAVLLLWILEDTQNSPKLSMCQLLTTSGKVLSVEDSF